MKPVLFLLLVFSSSSFFGQGSNAVDKNDSLPKIEHAVCDFEELLSPIQEIMLDTAIRDLKKNKGLSIYVVTTASISPFENMFDYSLALARKSGFGDVFIVLSSEKRLIQIQVSDYLRDKLTDKESESILQHTMLPQIKNGHYFEGLLNGIAEMKKELR